VGRDVQHHNVAFPGFGDQVLHEVVHDGFAGRLRIKEDVDMRGIIRELEASGDEHLVDVVDVVGGALEIGVFDAGLEASRRLCARGYDHLVRGVGVLIDADEQRGPVGRLGGEPGQSNGAEDQEQESEQTTGHLRPPIPETIGVFALKVLEG
jgi:hypothetical protein